MFRLTGACGGFSDDEDPLGRGVTATLLQRVSRGPSVDIKWAHPMVDVTVFCKARGFQSRHAVVRRYAVKKIYSILYTTV